MRWVTWVLIMALIGLQYELWFGHGNYFNMRQLKSQLLTQSQKNEMLIHRNNSLTAEVKDLAEGNDAIAEMARVNLGYIQTGEIFYRFVPPSALPAPMPPKPPASAS